MEIKDYLKPVSYTNNQFNKGFLGNITQYITQFTETEFANIDLCIIGIPEERNGTINKGTEKGPEHFRKIFYNHTVGNYQVKLADVGDIIIGQTPADTYLAVSFVIKELIQRKIVPIIIGGSNDLAYAQYQAYEKLEQIINITSIDHSFDIGDVGDEISSRAYLNKIILNQPNYLFNYSNIGYQTYLVTQDEIELMNKLYFDISRLGFIRSDITEAEPILRNADMVTFDLSAIKYTDAPGNNLAVPNGFYGEEACQLTRYAGISDKVSSIGFYELNPTKDSRNITSFLLSQMVWYFIDGFYNRKGEIPEIQKKDYLKYIINLEDRKEEFVFFKNLKSDRWWIDVPHPQNGTLRFSRHQMVPCSYKDYLQACNNEMPERWLKTVQKLM